MSHEPKHRCDTVRILMGRAFGLSTFPRRGCQRAIAERYQEVELLLEVGPAQSSGENTLGFTVILAMGQGRIAAAAINKYLAEKKKNPQ